MIHLLGTMSDAALATQLGLDRETVRDARRAAGIPACPRSSRGAPIPVTGADLDAQRRRLLDLGRQLPDDGSADHAALLARIERATDAAPAGLCAALARYYSTQPARISEMWRGYRSDAGFRASHKIS